MAPIATLTTYEYAAGTCTLRLVGELSPLSQVTGRPVLGRSRFTLQVHGDDAALGSGARDSQAVIFETSGREPQFSALVDLVQTYVQQQLQADALAAGGAVSRGENSLQPVGLTRHRLTLAAPPESPTITELSTLQLSDLADALEQADVSLQILPAAVANPRRRRPRLPLWLGSVAAVGIAALLGNQFLTTAPSPVVLSPHDSQPRESQPFDSSASNSPEPDAQAPPPAANRASADSAPDSPLEESAAAGDNAREPAAPPATTATAPPPPAASNGDPTAETPKTSPRAAPPARQPEAAPPIPAAPPQAARVAPPATDSAAEQAHPAIGSAPARPETFEPETSAGEAGVATSGIPEAASDWMATLTQVLQGQWRPPANLAAPLRYRLTLEPDGTVVALEPLNDFSTNRQNTPTLPQPGTTIPGVTRDSLTTVEVQFLPSGEVLVASPEMLTP